ncbi:hypothetical protein L596_012478 [Steinernema carpocapsae]|uniref:MADF domain-containing protein n=1 Tax=Steinernema carpocapsae TaxID=34508 RepID=A0A4U5NXE4_STECR|nr:hypothetical protein L596_012478 [Steinernema carpocapsae]
MTSTSQQVSKPSMALAAPPPTSLDSVISLSSIVPTMVASSSSLSCRGVSVSPSRRFDIGQLIFHVREEPVLYNNRHPDYKDSGLKDEKWERLARNMNFDEGGKVLCKKWKNVRDRYTKLSKAMKTGRPLDSKNKWKYFDELTFLERYLEERDRPKWDRPVAPKSEEAEPEVEMPHIKIDEDDCEMPEDEPNDLEDSFNPSSSRGFATSTTEKLLSLLDSVELPTSSTQMVSSVSSQMSTSPMMSESELFARSMAVTLDRFTPAQKSYVKMKMTELFYKVETDQEGPTAC